MVCLRTSQLISQTANQLVRLPAFKTLKVELHFAHYYLHFTFYDLRYFAIYNLLSTVYCLSLRSLLCCSLLTIHPSRFTVFDIHDLYIMSFAIYYLLSTVYGFIVQSTVFIVLPTFYSLLSFRFHFTRIAFTEPSVSFFIK